MLGGRAVSLVTMFAGLAVLTVLPMLPVLPARRASMLVLRASLARLCFRLGHRIARSPARDASGRPVVMDGLKGVQASAANFERIGVMQRAAGVVADEAAAVKDVESGVVLVQTGGRARGVIAEGAADETHLAVCGVCLERSI